MNRRLALIALTLLALVALACGETYSSGYRLPTPTAENLLAIERRPITHLAEVLGTSVNGSRLHYLLLDTAPSVGGLQENALYACDVLIVPAAVDYLSLEGVGQVIETIKAINRPRPPLA